MGSGVHPAPGSAAAPPAPARGGRLPPPPQYARGPGPASPPRAGAPLPSAAGNTFFLSMGLQRGGAAGKTSCLGGLFITCCQRGWPDRPTASPLAPRPLIQPYPRPCPHAITIPVPIPVSIPVPVCVPSPSLSPFTSQSSSPSLSPTPSPSPYHKTQPGDSLSRRRRLNPASGTSFPSQSTSELIQPHTPHPTLSPPVQTHPGPSGGGSLSWGCAAGPDPAHAHIPRASCPIPSLAGGKPTGNHGGKLRHGAGKARRAPRWAQAAIWMRPGPWGADGGMCGQSRQSRQLLPTHRGGRQPGTPTARHGQLLSACEMTQPGSGRASRDFLTQLPWLQNWGGPTPPCNNTDTNTPCQWGAGGCPHPCDSPQEHLDALGHRGQWSEQLRQSPGERGQHPSSRGQTLPVRGHALAHFRLARGIRQARLGDRQPGTPRLLGSSPSWFFPR